MTRRRPRSGTGAVWVLVGVVAVLLVAGCTGAADPVAGPPHDCPGAPPAGAPTGGGSPASTASSGPVGLDVRSTGAVGDGVTDDAPAIRAALAQSAAVHVPAGRYLLGSWQTPRSPRLDADFVFWLRSGQTITADPGAVFVLPPGSIAGSTAAWGGNVFLGDGVADVAITGLTLDLDGAHNLVPAGRTITGYGLYLYAARGVRLSGVTMLDTPGQNYVVAQGGGSDLVVQDSTFRNGGTSIPGNGAQDDFSAIYATASDVRVERVLITHDRQPTGYSGGVELHGSGGSVTGSRITDSYPAVYVGPDTATDLRRMTSTTIACNVLDRVLRGVVFNALGTGAIDGVVIRDNVVRLVRFAVFPDEPSRAVDQDRPPDGEPWTYHHVISGLDVRGNEVTDLDAGTDAVVRLSQVHGATIADNVLVGVHGSALVLSNSPWGLADVSFTGNRVDWLGSAAAPVVTVVLDDWSTAPGYAGYAGRDVVVADNRVVLDPDGGTNTCGVYVQWPDDAVVGAVRVTGNELDPTTADVCGPRAGSVDTGG
jgi:hypothetical protein